MIFCSKHTRYDFKGKIFYLFVLLSSCLMISQNNIEDDDAYLESVADVLANQYKEFNVLDSIFRKAKRDTLKMNYLVTKSKEINYREGQSYGLDMLGIYYRNKSYFERAIEAHEEAENLALESDNIELRILSLNMLGVVYRRMDAVKSALDYHQLALSIADSIKSPSNTIKKSIAVSQNSMGNIYLALEQYDLAIQQFQKSMEIERSVDNKLGLAINYHNIGYAKEATGNLDEALKNYLISLNYNEEIDSKIGKVICNNSIGQIYLQQGKIPEAYEIITSTITPAEEIDDKFYIASTYTNLGWVQTEMKAYREAGDNLFHALEVSKEFNLKGSEAEAYQRLSYLNEKLGNNKAALKHYKEYQNITNNIKSTQNTQYITELVLRYDAKQKSEQIKDLSNENEIVKLKLAQSKKTQWYALVGLLLLAGVLFGYYKQRQLSKDKMILTLEQDMLRAQMNPHFIFNSLNSIKLYIINNEKENAVYYLNKFSKLIRKILVASTEKEISLEDELETMTLYMNIENIRFNNEINYTVSVDDNVNTTNIKLPSLILQPFLENALWHGLSSKEGEKNIHLKVSRIDDGFVRMEITDNGIGRAESAKIQENKILKRHSVGIELTKQRLANFSRNYSGTYAIDIQDLHAHGVPSGTKVIIDIPIHEIKLKTA